MLEPGRWSLTPAKSLSCRNVGACCFLFFELLFPEYIGRCRTRTCIGRVMPLLAGLVDQSRQKYIVVRAPFQSVAHCHCVLRFPHSRNI
jgi:hypothetical protein